MKLLKLLCNIAEYSGKFGYVTIRTEPSMRKTDNPFIGRVTKVSTIQFRLQHYKSVKAAFNNTPLALTSVKPIPWAEHVSPYVIRHKTTGELYFQLKPERSHASFLLDGKLANVSELTAIKTYLPIRQEGPSWISVKLDNIIRLNVSQQKFENKKLTSIEDVIG